MNEPHCHYQGCDSIGIRERYDTIDECRRLYCSRHDPFKQDDNPIGFEEEVRA